MEDPDLYQEVHLIKIKLKSKNDKKLRIQAPYTPNFTPKVQLKQKHPLFIPLVEKMFVSRDYHLNEKKKIPIIIKQLLEHPFDKHNIKIQTYIDNDPKLKGDMLNLSIQFSRFILFKHQPNYVTINFKQAHLKKDLAIFGKMNPYLKIISDNWIWKSQQIKDGHMNPHFNQQIQIPFQMIFDKIIVQVRHGNQKIGEDEIYIFQLLGKDEQKQIQLKRQFKMVGTVTFQVLDLEPDDL